MSSTSHGSSRRTVLKGAAWSAPLIVVATAAPSFAASGPAMVTTTVSPTSDNSGQLPVVINYNNANTGNTGSTTAVVTLTPIVGGVSADDPTAVSTGWVFVSSSASGLNARSFTFLRADGIPGAPNATSTRLTFLSFTATTTPAATLSTGDIGVVTTPTNGTVTTGTGVWT